MVPMKKNKKTRDIGTINRQQALVFANNLAMSAPRIIMDMPIFLKMQYYIAQCGPEVSGLGAVRTGEIAIPDAGMVPAPLRFFVDDVFILEQDVTAHTTNLTEGTANLVAELMEAGRDDYVEMLKFRWHSHAGHDIGAYFSADFDIPSIENLGRTGMLDYIISYVGTHGGQYLARLDLFKPVRITIEGIQVLVTLPKDRKLIKKCAKDIRSRVTVVEPDPELELIEVDDVVIHTDAGMIRPPELPLVVTVGEGR